MSAAPTLKPLLKRGALVTAANWQMVGALFLMDALFKALLLVPLAGGVVLVVMLVGGDPSDFFRASPSAVLPAMARVLLAHTGALGWYLLSVLLVLAAGSLVMLAARAGVVTVLVAAERTAGSIEAPPLHLSKLTRAACVSLERFTTGSERLFGRFVRLGALLAVVYAVSIAGYFAVILGAGPVNAAWPAVATAASVGLVAWFTLVNFVHVLFQAVIGASDRGIRAAVGPVWRLLTRAPAVWGIFAAMLGIGSVATAASILATAALGLIAFVPLAGLAALPLQVLAWAARGALFQFLDLTALVAYLHILGTGPGGDTPAAGDVVA